MTDTIKYPLSVLDSIDDGATVEPRTVAECRPVLFNGDKRARGVFVLLEDGGELCLRFKSKRDLAGLIGAAEIAKLLEVPK